MDLHAILGALISRLNPTPTMVPVTLADGNRRAAAVHKDYSVLAQEGPRAPYPAHQFTDLADFAAWCAREVELGRWLLGEAAVLVGAGSVVALDGSYKQHPSRVDCTLAAHPYWCAWAKLADGGWLASGDLLEALREIEPSFAFEYVTVAGERRPVSGATRIMEALRALSVGDSSDATVERDAGGMARVQARQGKVTTSMQIPERWSLLLPAFDAAPDLLVPLEALVSWRHDREAGDLVFRVRLPLMPVALRKARALVVDRLRGFLPEWTIGQGEARVLSPRLD